MGVCQYFNRFNRLCVGLLKIFDTKAVFVMGSWNCLILHRENKCFDIVDYW